MLPFKDFHIYLREIKKIAAVKMSKTLGKASSLFNVIKKLKHQDCANFLSHLDDRGVELFCRILHYVLNGDLPIHGKARTRLQKKNKSSFGRI